MSRIETTEPQPPSIWLNLACLAAPTLVVLVEQSVRLPVIFRYFASDHMVIMQWVLGFFAAMVLAYCAPTPRLRSAAKWYVYGTLLLPFLIIGFVMYLARSGGFH